MDEDRVVVAEILRSRGNKGEVLARSQTDVPGRLENLKTAQVRLSDGTDVPVELQAAWPYREDWVLKFVGIGTISDAERFSGADLWIPREERGSLPEGEYFQSDLIGVSVVHRQTGDLVGVVTGLEHYGASPLLQVDVKDRTVLVPFVDAICPEVDLVNRIIRVELPEGLLDL